MPSPIAATTLNDANCVDTANDGHPIFGAYADYQYPLPPTVLTSQVVLLLELGETQAELADAGGIDVRGSGSVARGEGKRHLLFPSARLERIRPVHGALMPDGQ